MGKCKILNKEEIEINLQHLWNGNVSQIKSVSSTITNNIRNREDIMDKATIDKNKIEKPNERKTNNIEPKINNKRKRLVKESDNCGNRYKKRKTEEP